MAIEPGKQLLHYRVAEKIGEGGMGVVWKAVDTTLDREVAIKVLPQAFAGDAERLARFEREAKLLASLNHPHIAAVYGLHAAPSTGSGQALSKSSGQADTPEGSVRFIAMELVGGEDLSQRLARGPLTAARALTVASQIAQGLSAAHEAGVIHRDLKPANIKMTPDGKVKVLDFGLAKAFEPGAASGAADLANSPTMTSAGTRVGMILGTAPYMSPEQARGRPVDRRTDLWAFGALLFEMLAGRPPFPGEATTEIIAKIIEREPRWDALPSPLHPGVRRLLERCLAKDPELRLRDAADARLEIADLLEDPTGEQLAAAGEASASASRPGPVAARSWTRALPWVVAAALLIWAVAATMLRPTALPSRVVHFEINPPTGHQFAEFATSPDGASVAFVASNRQAVRSLWVRGLESTENRRLAGTEGAWFPFWSPESRRVAFFSRGKLRAIDVASETIQTIADAPNGRGGAWGHDDTILFAPEGASVLYAVPASGGSPRAVTTLQPPEASHRFPHFVGASRRFTYSAHDADSSHTRRRYLASLDSDKVARLDDGMSETYAPPGHALYVREETLFAQPLDVSKGVFVGKPFPLARDIDDTFPRTARAAFSVSDNGVLMYLARRKVRSRIDAYGRRGQRLETVVPGARYENLSFSGDRRQLLFTRTSAQESSVWRRDLIRASESRLLLLPVPSINVAWSADDRSVVYAIENGIHQMPVDGGEPEQLLDSAKSEQGKVLNAINGPSVSSDGRYLAFSAWDPVSDFDLWILPLTGERTPRRLSDATGVQDRPAVSPDSCWIAYESNESGAFEVYVKAAGDRASGSGSGSCPASTGTWLVSTGGGSAPVWNEDGRELYYVAADYGIMAVPIERPRAGREFEAGLPARLFDGPLSIEDDADIFFRQPTMVAVDGDRFLFQVADEDVRDRTIQVVLNWSRILADGRHAMGRPPSARPRPD